MTTQTLDRAVALMRLLAGTPGGARLVDLQAKTGLTKPTVHRILATLCQHDLATRDPETRRYKLGREITLLAAGPGASNLDIVDLARDHMIEVAQRTADTSFLMIRSGFDAVCLDRQTGSYPVKAFTVEVGTRRPLGLGAGGLIFLASLDDAMRETALQRASDTLTRNGKITIAKIRVAAEKAREKGYAFSDGFVVEGVCAIAVPVRTSDDKVIATISVAAIKDRLPQQRIPQLLSVLQTHAKSIERRLKETSSPKKSIY